MTKHTPGPWFADAQFVGVEGGDTFIVTCHDGFVGRDAARANARLIAAAPVMLAALKDAERLLNIWLANNTDELFEEQSEIDDVRCLLSDTIELAEGSDQ